MARFSVLMSVYKNTKPDELIDCFNSLLKQTVQANEYVIVIDGPIPKELQDGIDEIKCQADTFKIVALETNQGLGLALRAGMEQCSYELIARMDTDDIAKPTRFEKQLACFELDPDLSVVGSNIAEFQENIRNITSYRNVPEKHEEICEFLKHRCPFNHMTVMFKKSEVEKAGGYMAWHYNEDSYLWVRMYLAGCKFYNIQDILVYARIDKNTFKRRGGYKYYKSERDLFKFMHKKNIIGFWSCRKAVLERFIVYVLMPNGIREWSFKKFVRNKQ